MNSSGPWSSLRTVRPRNALTKRTPTRKPCDSLGVVSSTSRFLHVARPTVEAELTRFATEHVAQLLDKSSAPNAPARKVWLPLMIEVYHLQKRHPDAGKFRIWSRLGHPEISVRTVARIM